MNKILTYHYKFIFEDKIEKEFDIKLDNKTLNIITEKKDSYPEWTGLKYHKCLNCSLDENNGENGAGLDI